jgi:transposase
MNTLFDLPAEWGRQIRYTQFERRWPECADGKTPRRACWRSWIWRRGCRSIIRCARSSGWRTKRWRGLSPVFDQMYAEDGRPSIPPERLLKASLLISLYSVRSERAFCEELDYHLLFRWFLDMSLVEPSFDPSTFSKNRERLLRHRVAQQFFDQVVVAADRLGLLSDEHFTVDGTLIEAAASLKSFRPKDQPPSDTPPDDPGNPTVNFHGQQRLNATHQSTTDSEARLFRKGKGKEARLTFMAHALMENRNGLLVDFQVTTATGTAEREMAVRLVDEAEQRRFHPKTLGADKNYDTAFR